MYLGIPFSPQKAEELAWEMLKELERVQNTGVAPSFVCLWVAVESVSCEGDDLVAISDSGYHHIDVE